MDTVPPIGEADSSGLSGHIPLLPPCRVCGERASGFHYGANTCEACKGFFRRSLQRKDMYKCIGDGDCEIVPGKRNSCAYCRYQKCLTLGMSKTAIKTGRYTHQKKTKDIQEVKKLQHQRKIQKDNKIVKLPSNDRERELEDIAQKILAFHKEQAPHSKEFFEKLPEKEKEFLEQKDLQQEMFGTMKPIPRDEYMKIYQSTGIDVDGRREMIKHMIPCIEKAIKRFIAFAKALPGFKDLPLEDQINLIKVSRFEVWVIAAHRSFNPEKCLFCPIYGPIIDFEGMCKLHSTEYVQYLFQIVTRIHKLKLNDSECSILGAMELLFTDRGELLKPDQVQNCQDEMLELLDYIVRRDYPHDKIRIARLLMLLVDLRSLKHRHLKEEERFSCEWRDKIEFPPMIYEMWST